MRFFDLLFVGLMQIADRSHYKGIPEFISAWGLGLILELNFIAIIGIFSLGQIVLKPYILIPLYVALFFLSLKYYQFNKLKLDKLSAELKEKYKPNMTSGELLAIIVTIESVTAPLILGLSRN
jgi:hypothetical protein